MSRDLIFEVNEVRNSSVLSQLDVFVLVIVVVVQMAVSL